MPKLPRIKPRQLIRALKKAGFMLDRVHGSHYIFYRDNIPDTISVPVHSRDMKTGTLSSILKAANLTIEEFIKLL
jgi:predicted RNA binding protein YcfA (HicA-like mRNA interferase family)